MNKDKEFLKNTIILFIGKFATQFIQFLLLPLFTHYLLTDDYGTVDLIQTYIALFVPILTLRLDSAAFRFLIDLRDDENSKRKLISSIFFVLIICILSCIIICFAISYIIQIKYFGYVVTNIVILMVSNLLLQILRGLGKNKQYSICSAVTGAITLVTNIILIICFKYNASSILISSSCANIFCILYIIISTRLFKYIKISSFSKEESKKILKYSLPMIPNALSWWIVNISDRTIISIFLGTAFNGIYTVSCKFSNILNNIYSIVNMSWQESASLHIDDDDRDEFFTKMIDNLLMLFCTISLLIIGILPLIFSWLIGNEYLDAYNYIPILLYANSWNVLISLIGAIYIAKKRTKEIANTTLISAIINIIINLALIKFIGLYAACISTLISYMIMGIYRYIDCRKYVNVKLKIKKYIIYTTIYLVSTIFYLSNNIYTNIINSILVVIYTIIIYKELIKALAMKLIQSKLGR